MRFCKYESKNKHGRELFSNRKIFFKNNRPTANFNLFDEKVNKLSTFYTIEDFFSLKSFLKEHVSSFILLEEVKPILKDVFPEKPYHLIVEVDPEFDYSTLMIIVKVDYSEEPTEKTIDKLSYANSRFAPFKRRKRASTDIFIDVESL